MSSRDDQTEPERDPDVPGQVPTHDATGLDLARRIARAVSENPLPAPVSPKAKRTRPARGGRPMADDRDLQSVGGAMEDLIERRGWARQVNVHLLMARWPVFVGPVNADHSVPESYADGVLVVRTDSTAWATSLRTMAAQLVARLNEELGEGSVKRIQVLGPDAPSWNKGRRRVSGGRGPRDTYG